MSQNKRKTLQIQDIKTRNQPGLKSGNASHRPTFLLLRFSGLLMKIPLKSVGKQIRPSRINSDSAPTKYQRSSVARRTPELEDAILPATVNSPCWGAATVSRLVEGGLRFPTPPQHHRWQDLTRQTNKCCERRREPNGKGRQSKKGLPRSSTFTSCCCLCWLPPPLPTTPPPLPSFYPPHQDPAR